MDDIPKRLSLINQTVACLHSRIATGDWRGWLPSERALAEQLQISRSTLRTALAKLRHAGVIRSRHGSGTEILSPRSGRTRPFRSRDVALLTPLPLEELQPRQTLFIDELRGLLSERGLRLRVFHGAGYFRANPASVLRKLIENEPHGCWILSMANEGVQRWFHRNRIPSVVAGSIYPGVELPFSDLDHRATCRHAAGVLLRLGHTRIAFFTFKSSRAGELESVAGFREGVRQSGRSEVEAAIVYHEETTGSICQFLRRLMEQKTPPTALLVANAYYFLAVSSRLGQLARRIPQDISVISRDEGSFLNYLMPAPARYVASPHLMTKNLLRPVLEVLESGFVTGRGRFIMPEFVRGESIGPPAETSL